MSAQLGYRSYDWGGSREWLAEIGGGTTTILIVPPLFEELNRCRALLAGLMRGLAAAGLRAILPDLPGTGESPRELAQVEWEDWIGALQGLSSSVSNNGQAVHLASFRGGCILETDIRALSRWRFAPAAGPALARDLIRARQAASPDKPRADSIEAQARAVATEFAGYLIPPGMFGALLDARTPDHATRRTVRLATDPAAADLKLDGKPLWRQAEPGNDAELAAAIASDIALWVRTCAA